jgi:preprotein translocase subunit SecF
MQILKHKTHIDFIGKRKPALFISTILNLAIIVGVAIFGFNFGVDFAGGTLVEVKFPYDIKDTEVRAAALKGGLHDPTVQAIGPASENAFLLRMGGTTQLTPERAEKAKAAITALDPPKFFHPNLDTGLINFRSSRKLTPEEIKKAVEQGAGIGVKDVRELGRSETTFDYQLEASGMAEQVTSALKTGLDKKEFEVRRIEYVGPQVGKQLRNKGVMALLYAMAAILIYVAFRFDFKFGPGALLAMVHDVVMVAGYYLVSRREFNLTSIAVLLTILGYSINDTIVIYDRIREEMVRYKGKPLPEIINIAVNDTLSRTILTSGVTALSLVGLLIFGVGEIFDFAAAMLIGIIVGTYSSVYIASPLTIWLDERAAARAKRPHGGMSGAAASR